MLKFAKGLGLALVAKNTLAIFCTDVRFAVPDVKNGAFAALRGPGFPPTSNEEGNLRKENIQRDYRRLV